MGVWWVVVLISSHYHLPFSTTKTYLKGSRISGLALPEILPCFGFNIHFPLLLRTLGSQFHFQANLRQVPVVSLSQTGGQQRDFAALVLNSFRLPSRLSDFWEGTQPL